jgi:RNA polymerase sigma factor for flagellar operon FliA
MEAEGLWGRWLEGNDPKAREELIEHYLPYVKVIARKYRRSLPYHADMDDLVSAGMIGLIEAINRFSPEKGIPFEGYAAQRVRGAMTDSLRKLDWAPAGVRSQARKVKQAVSELNQKNGRYPAHTEIAEYLGISEGELAKWDRRKEVARLDNIDEAMENAGVEPVATEDGPHDEVDATAVLKEVKRALTTLPEREQRLMFLYYDMERSMEEIAQLLGVTLSRVSQLHAEAIKKLKREIAA